MGHATIRPRQPRRAAPTIVVALVTACVVLLGGIGGAPRSALAADPTLSLGSRLQPRPIPDLIRLGTTVRFFGRGYGHGVGMSQYGARGRALAGQTAATILAHYYRGTTLGSISSNTPIRVRVLSGWTATPAAPLLVYGRLAAWTVDGIAGSFPADAALRLIPATTSTATGPRTTWRLRITAASGAVLHDAPKPASVVVRSAAAGGLLQLWSKPSSYDRFRGVLRIIASATTPTVNVADELPLETYLRGVVPVEMPSTWPTQALKAQAIAVPLVCRSPAAPGRLVLRRHRRHELAGLPRGARREGGDERDHRRDGGRRPAQPQRRHRQRAVPFDRRRRDREQRERLRVIDRREGGGPGELPARLERSRPGRQRLRRGIPIRDVGHQDVHRGPAVGLVRRRRPDRTSGR